jgi:hypothetical protein
MSQDDNILQKADALLNKRHAGSYQPDTGVPSQREDSGYLYGFQAAIPTLTEIVVHDLESDLERELIPTLTEAIDSTQALSSRDLVELDLDPDYAYHDPDEGLHPEEPALMELEATAEDVVEEFILDEAALEQPETEAEAESETVTAAQQFEEIQPPPAESVPEVDALAETLQQELETLLQETVEPEEPVAAAPLPLLPVEEEAAPVEVAPEAPPELEAIEQVTEAAVPPRPEPVSQAYRVERRMHISDSVAEQLLASLQQQVPKLLEQAIVPKLAAALDREISALIDQFTIHIEYVVRDAITQELQKQLPELEARLANPGKPPVDPV